jgi:hypothetical protein
VLVMIAMIIGEAATAFAIFIGASIISSPM